SSFPQGQKTKNRNLKFVIPTKVGIQNAKSQETVLPDKFPYRQTWIPACAGMTKPSARKPAAMIQLPFAQEHHAPISITFQENGNF
ncbi:TPA: hypothetical protein ACJKBZ_002146, partial [Neisseria meningitidis]